MNRESATRYLVYGLVSVALFCPLLVWNYWPGPHGIDNTGYQIGRDFINVWAAPQLALGGKLATLFDQKAYHAAIGALYGYELPFHNWSYPLFTLPVFWPLAQLPYFVALAVWTAGLFAIYAAVTLSQIERAQRTAALFILALAPAALINTIGGQTGFLSASLFLGGILQLNRRPVLAGVLFGLLTFKPHLGLILPFALLALGAWRTIAAAVVTAGTLFGLSVALFGFGAWRTYLDVAGSHQTVLLEQFYGFYTNMMVSVFADLRQLGVGYQAALAAQVAVAVPVVVLACWAVRRTADPCRRALVLACAMPLLTPYGFNYDLTSVTAALVWVLAGRLPFRQPWSPVYLLAFAAPTSAMLLGIPGIGTLPLVALFVLSVGEATRPPEPFTAAPDTGGAAQVPDSTYR